MATGELDSQSRSRVDVCRRQIRLTAGQFKRLAAAFFAELKRGLLQSSCSRPARTAACAAAVRAIGTR